MKLLAVQSYVVVQGFATYPPPRIILGDKNTNLSYNDTNAQQTRLRAFTCKERETEDARDVFVTIWVDSDTPQEMSEALLKATIGKDQAEAVRILTMFAEPYQPKSLWKRLFG